MGLKMVESNKKIFYLRADNGTQDLIGGGSVAHTLGVIKGFLNHGYHVVCASSAMHKVLTSVKHQNFSCHYLTVPYSFVRFGFKISCILSNIVFYYKLRKLFETDRIHLIYQRYSMLNVVGVWLSKKYKVPLVLEYNGSEVWVDEHWSPAKIRMSWLLRIAENYNLRHANKIIVVSQVLKDQLLERRVDASKIELNLNGVDVELFNPARLINQRSMARRELNVEEKFLVGFSGTFGPWHGIDVLSTIIPKAVKQHKRLHFLLMGDGPLKDKLMSRVLETNASEGVTFVGMLHVSEMPYYLSACDAFICPTQPNKDGSRFFGSPTKLFEYMAMGKPVVASDLEQLAQVLDIPICKPLLITPHEHDKFYEALVSLMNMDIHQHYEIGVALQQKVEHYTWHAHVARMIASIEKLV